MKFADYSYYISDYGGDSIPSNKFQRFMIKASNFVNKITFNRINNITDDVKMTTCAVADEMFKIEKNNGIKTSETVGKYAVSYYVENISEEKIFYNIAKLYLSEELLYRGVK